MSEDISSLKEKEMREQEQETDVDRPSNNWVAGAVLIVIGVIFLISNTTSFHLDNWWALFILIPALVSFANVWNSYRQHGRLTKGARGSLTGGFVLTLIASAFLFNLDWGLIWPLFLIIGGIGALLGGWFD